MKKLLLLFVLLFTTQLSFSQEEKPITFGAKVAISTSFYDEPINPRYMFYHGLSGGLFSINQFLKNYL